MAEEDVAISLQDDGINSQKGVKGSRRKRLPRTRGTKQRGKRRLEKNVNSYSKRTKRKDDERSGVRVTCGGEERNVVRGSEM